MRLAVLLLLACMGAATAADGLYDTQTIVTGQREETRKVGFARAFETVLVKVSGDPRLIGDPRVAAMADEAGSMVAGFSYRDRLAGIPIHDEQGTRDRPYDLFVSFRPERIDAVLRALGRTPWPEPRPRVTLVLTVENGPSRYLLASDGKRGRDQREALTAAAEQVGVPLTLPSEADLAKVDPETMGGERVLLGHLVWSERDLGWNADWRLTWGGRTVRWRITGVSFDEAFRNAMRGTAQVLSGNGEPS